MITETTLNEAQACVKKGATLLDRISPTWFKKVNLDKLNMQLCSACILGQLYKDYWNGIDTLQEYFLEENFDERKYGFLTNRTSFHILNKYWIKEIQERLNNEAVS